MNSVYYLFKKKSYFKFTTPFLRETELHHQFCINIFLKEENLKIFKLCILNNHISFAKKNYFWFKETYFVTTSNFFFTDKNHLQKCWQSTFYFFVHILHCFWKIMMYENHFQFFYQMFIAVLVKKINQSK